MFGQQQVTNNTLMDITLAIESDVQNGVLNIGNTMAGNFTYDEMPTMVCARGEMAASENGTYYCRKYIFNLTFIYQLQLRKHFLLYDI